MVNKDRCSPHLVELGRDQRRIGIPSIGKCLSFTAMVAELLRQWNLFSESELKHTQSYFKRREFKEGEFFIQKGDLCAELAFVESGVFHVYRMGDAKTQTLRFACEGSIVSAYSSYITAKPSRESVEAIAPAVAWIIRKEDIVSLAAHNPAWAKFHTEVADYNYLELERYTLETRHQSAGERYRYILENHPECVLGSPLKILALYLGITPRHLSRIRGQYAE